MLRCDPIPNLLELAEVVRKLACRDVLERLETGELLWAYRLLKIIKARQSPP